jgi:hypothetical protein
LVSSTESVSSMRNVSTLTKLSMSTNATIIRRRRKLKRTKRLELNARRSTTKDKCFVSVTSWISTTLRYQDPRYLSLTCRTSSTRLRRSAFTWLRRLTQS